VRCHKCGADAIGVCRFCGRAVCHDHYRPMPYVLTVYSGENGVPKAVVVADVLFCGTCRPQPEPIPMPELF
jgi:hypothetical protein